MKGKRKKIIKIAIDSPAAAGAGTLAKSISKHYNLYYLDTGKIYRLIAYLKLLSPKKFTNKFLRKRIKNLKQKDLSKRILLSEKVGIEASIISKNIGIEEAGNFVILVAIISTLFTVSLWSKKELSANALDKPPISNFGYCAKTHKVEKRIIYVKKILIKKIFLVLQ